MQQETITVAGRDLAVWPSEQSFTLKGHDIKILRTTFADTALYHPGLIDHILGLAGDPRYAGQYGRALGGTKLYHVDQWDCPEARLLHARAVAFFNRAMASEQVAVDIAWANVYREGDYIVPHSHTRSVASLVYFLEPGDDDPRDPNSGAFSFVDPRLKDCCLVEPDAMTNPLHPPMTPGTMLLFPSYLVHTVNPYGGKAPRITLSWNMNFEAVPGSPLDANAPRG